MEAEVAGFVEAYAHLTGSAGRRQIVRHGHLPEREIQTGIGPVAVRCPRVRDRGAGATGPRVRFTSRILPPYLRRAKSIEELLPWLYLKGISTGDFCEALAALMGSKCLHPLFVFNQFGDLKRCALHPGNVHSADGWEDVLRPVLARYSAEARPSITRRRFRVDAAFAIPALFDALEAEGWDYAIRIKGNPKLHEQVTFLTRRRPGRPPNHLVRHYTSFQYRAKSWSKPRRIVTKVEFHPGELFPTVGFIVTNRSLPNERVLAFYNDRGTAEQHIKKGKYALKWTRLSCMRFAANAARLRLHGLAYNLANFLRTLATPEEIERWSLTSLHERLIKTGARLVRHGRYAAFQMAEASLPRAVFAGLYDLIIGLRDPRLEHCPHDRNRVQSGGTH